MRSPAMCLTLRAKRWNDAGVSSGISYVTCFLPRVKSVTSWPCSTSWRAR